MDRSQFPSTVAPGWRPRDEAWLQRAPSPFMGVPARPLFIGACPRSGTTLLRVMLDSHPDLAIPHETNFIRQLWWRRLRFGDLRDHENRLRVARWIFTTKDNRASRLRDGRIRRRDAIRRVADAPPTIGSIVQACLRLYADVNGKPRWGDKRPAYSGFIGTLFTMFPNAQYINVVRDPRGAVASQIPMGWDPPGAEMTGAVARWEAAVLRTDGFAARLRPDQLMDVRYEDLVSDPRATLERVCAFAGLRAGDAVDAMLSKPRGELRGSHRRVAQPITTTSIERWRERLEPREVALVEQATAPLLDRFGYVPAEDLRAAVAPRDARELERRRREARRAWRRSQRGELLRRAIYRRPVAALADRPRS